jgi:hypothetical protein
MSASANGSSPLRQVLQRSLSQAASADVPLSMTDLTVLGAQRDPYRLDTVAGHRNGTWFAEQIARFLRPTQTIHLRGLHYIVTVKADVLMPNGLPYINTEASWNWLADVAAKAARWLGYVAFERIVDERNAPAELFIPEDEDRWVWTDLSTGLGVEVPGLESVLPELRAGGFAKERQPFRIILVGEKTSLGEVLRPVAELVGGELLLPTGEASDTMIAELVARVVEDGRPAVVLYFSDFDPSGRQMPVSFARKLQALRDLAFPTLDIQVHPVALTIEQVRSFRLPSTPLKETEKRADKWREVMGYEQVEIDSLAALRPAELRAIALAALEPFFDRTLARRQHEARAAWYEATRPLLENHPLYQEQVIRITEAREMVLAAVGELRAAQQNAQATFGRIELPLVTSPAPEISAEAPNPLFTTKTEFTDATRQLIAHKALEGD